MPFILKYAQPRVSDRERSVIFETKEYSVRGVHRKTALKLATAFLKGGAVSCEGRIYHRSLMSISPAPHAHPRVLQPKAEFLPWDE